jgi:hypothetical protein
MLRRWITRVQSKRKMRLFPRESHRRRIDSNGHRRRNSGKRGSLRLASAQRQPSLALDTSSPVRLFASSCFSSSWSLSARLHRATALIRVFAIGAPGPSKVQPTRLRTARKVCLFFPNLQGAQCAAENWRVWAKTKPGREGSSAVLASAEAHRCLGRIVPKHQARGNCADETPCAPRFVRSFSVPQSPTAQPVSH